MRIAIVSALLVVVVGCGKDEAKGTAATMSASAQAAASAPAQPAASALTAPPPATAAVTASAATQASLPKCPAGLTGNATPAFCIKLPAGYSVKDARTSPTRGSIAYETGSPTDSLMVSYDENSVASLAKDVEGELKFGGDKLEKKGDLPGGNKWFQGSHQDYERVVTLFKGPGALTLKCSFAFKPKSAPPKEAIDACKSIVVPSGS
ncbi:MAG TPA: hypothetical protein VE987_04205 [Polyangiaceae bacterium]|nr:hypothetical protein [Polyangiaceae bacterium]